MAPNSAELAMPSTRVARTGSLLTTLARVAMVTSGSPTICSTRCASSGSIGMDRSSGRSHGYSVLRIARAAVIASAPAGRFMRVVPGW